MFFFFFAMKSCYKDKEMSLSVQAQCKDKIERMHATIKGLKAKTRWVFFILLLYFFIEVYKKKNFFNVWTKYSLALRDGIGFIFMR